MNSFENFINDYELTMIDSRIKDAMVYALDGGKRFRPSLIFSIMDGFGAKREVAYHSALALEMIHTYSLIHDDLPCMDDDDYRRGKLSVHKAFEENTAVLAGDGLLTEAFGVVAKDEGISFEKRIKIIKYLSSLAGVGGMIHGQLLDLQSENSTHVTDEMLEEIDDYKTGCLFRCSLLIPMVLVEDEEHEEFYNMVGTKIGRIFQIQDDLFDVIKTQEETGKPSNSDSKNAKATALSINSVDEIRKKLNKEFDEIYNLLVDCNFNTEYLRNIIKKIEKR